jgi:hypothetical protein
MKQQMQIMGLALLLVVGCSTVQKKQLVADVKVVEGVVNTVAPIVAAVDPNAATTVAAVKVAEAVVNDVYAATQVERHTVIQGDCLWNIDKKHDGDGFGWFTIYRANRDQITDYNVIEPGMALEWHGKDDNSLYEEDRARAKSEPKYVAADHRRRR